MPTPHITFPIREHHTDFFRQNCHNFSPTCYAGKQYALLRTLQLMRHHTSTICDIQNIK